MRSIKKAALVFLSAAVVFSACRQVEEEAPEQIYYIEASESFYIPEKVSETTLIPETSTTAETTTTTVETTTTTEETTTTTEETTTTTEETTTTTEETTTTAEETATAAPEPELYSGSYPADENLVKLMGRTFTRGGVRMLSHTCSGVEFAFRGTSADVTLTSNCKTSKARVMFYVNGEPLKDVMLNNAEETFHLFDSEKPRNCIISVVKLSESAYSNVGVKSIDVVSEYGIIPTPEKSRKIEFIGDSITCGYGVDAADQNEDFSTTTENGEKTYAAIAAKALNADYHIISWSGIGVYSSYTESSNPNQKSLMPSVYDKTAASDLSGEMWDFSQWQPDVVVINLGTNDNTWTKGIEERVDKFGAAYYDFIVQVRRDNPNAFIICSLGIMGSKLLPEIKEQVALYSENTGDYRITTFEFDYRDGVNDGFGADFHPSAVTHQKAADKLVPFISELMGWQ